MWIGTRLIKELLAAVDFLHVRGSAYLGLDAVNVRIVNETGTLHLRARRAPEKPRELRNGREQPTGGTLGSRLFLFSRYSMARAPFSACHTMCWHKDCKDRLRLDSGLDKPTSEPTAPGGDWPRRSCASRRGIRSLDVPARLRRRLPRAGDPLHGHHQDQSTGHVPAPEGAIQGGVDARPDRHCVRQGSHLLTPPS